MLCSNTSVRIQSLPISFLVYFRFFLFPLGYMEPSAFFLAVYSFYSVTIIYSLATILYYKKVLAGQKESFPKDHSLGLHIEESERFSLILSRVYERQLRNLPRSISGN